ncbi:unnamed protein product [Absidia cylindrospora]
MLRILMATQHTQGHSDIVTGVSWRKSRNYQFALVMKISRTDCMYRDSTLKYHRPTTMTTPLTRAQFAAWLSSNKLDRITLPKFNDNKDSIRPWLHQYETLITEQKKSFGRMSYLRAQVSPSSSSNIHQQSSWSALSTALLTRFATSGIKYATDWQNEVNRMHTQKSGDELVERFIMSLSDGRVISALATVMASTKDDGLEDIIDSGLKIDRTINGIKNKQQYDNFSQPQHSNIDRWTSTWNNH